MLLPLGRHSIMNGVAVALDAPHPLVDKQTEALLAQFVSWDELFAWQKTEALRLAADAGLTADAIPYEQWAQAFPASSAASRDAYLRLRHVDPQWVVRTFPRLPKPYVVDLTKRHRPDRFGPPHAGKPLDLSPGPDGHEVRIRQEDSSGWEASCLEPPCAWAVASPDFVELRAWAYAHATAPQSGVSHG